MFSVLHRKFILPLVEQRSGIATKNHLKFLNQTEEWLQEEIRSYQWNRIKVIVEHAYNNTLFYRKRFDNIGLTPNDIRTLKDFIKIPPVTRGDINADLEEMVAGNISERDRHFDATGGSTGLPTRFVRDNACLAIKKASEYRFNMWAGWRPGEKILYYWPALRDFSGKNVKYKLTRCLLYSRQLGLYAGRLNEGVLSEHFYAFKKFRPNLIRAFPSALQKFAEYVERSGNRIPEPRAIISVGEPLIESQRALFTEVFGCEVFNCYVSRECGNIACECSNHNGMHIAEELLYLEIDNEKNSNYGEILLTDLWNLGMPLIRYKIQDMARWMESNCSCGRGHRLLAVDAARISDFLISPFDGSYISGSTLTHYLLAEGPKIGRVKLIQTAPDQLKVIMVRDESSNIEGIEHIKSKLNVIFKGSVQLVFEMVDSIPLLPSGKYSFVERQF